MLSEYDKQRTSSGLDLNHDGSVCHPPFVSWVEGIDAPRQLVFAQVMEHLPLTSFATVWLGITDVHDELSTHSH
jgi:hypothetical protein